MIIKNGPVGEFFYINGVRQNAYQLIQYEGNYYFVYDGHELVRNGSAYVEERFILDGYTFPNGDPLVPGRYEFDAEGKMIIKNGPVGEFFYINGVRQNAYQLVEYDGGYYFIGDEHKIAKNAKVWLSAKYVAGKTYADGSMIEVGYHYFDEQGRMIVE